MSTANNRQPLKLKIVELPNNCDYLIWDVPAISFDGLLCAVEYNDGTYEFIDSPYLDCDKNIGELPGIYKIYVYLDEQHSYGLYATFKIRVEDPYIVHKMIKSEI